MRRRARSLLVLIATALLVLVPASAAGASGRVVAATAGGGSLLVGGELEVKFQFNALARENGTVSGRSFHSVVVGGQLVEFAGEVTCVTVDAENDRAWVGGVITANNSEHPGWLQPQHQVGRDIWFRVVDNGEGSNAVADRSTFVGFEGAAGIITSEEYCTTQPWPADDGGTNPLDKGNIQVHD